jgi:hypothetical protein
VLTRVGSFAIRNAPETEEGGGGGMESNPETPCEGFSAAGAGGESGLAATGPPVTAESATNDEKLRTIAAISVTIEASGISDQ